MALKDGRLRVAVGASRSGKTAWVADQVQGRRRLMVWDIEGKYPADHRPRNVAELARLVLALKHCAGRIAYTGALADFDAFCRVAFEWARYGSRAGVYSCVVIEETSDVTSPGKAPPGYGILIRRGLKYACDIYAICQRPAESDKTTFGNASMIHCCRLSMPRDRKMLADYMGTTPERLGALAVDREAGRFDYLQHDLEAGTLTPGTMVVTASGPVFRRKKTEKPL